MSMTTFFSFCLSLFLRTMIKTPPTGFKLWTSPKWGGCQLAELRFFGMNMTALNVDSLQIAPNGLCRRKTEKLHAQTLCYGLDENFNMSICKLPLTLSLHRSCGEIGMAKMNTKKQLVKEIKRRY